MTTNSYTYYIHFNESINYFRFNESINHIHYNSSPRTDMMSDDDEDDDDFIPFEPVAPKTLQFECVVNPFPINEEDLTCGICMEEKPVEHIAQLNCKHTLCGTCFLQHKSQNHKNFVCPFCRTNIQSVTVQTENYKQEMEQKN